MRGSLEVVAGLLVMGLIVADIFVTVLYARAGTSLFSRRLARGAWWSFRLLGRGGHRATVLSFCGPAIVIVLIAFWSLGLSVGAALAIHPALGTSVVATGGPTDRDFVTALYAGSNSLSIVGSGSYGPHTTRYRLLYILASLVGVSSLSLTLTYVMQVYSALQRRNALGLRLWLLSGETGRAAELLARMGAGGDLSGATSSFAQLLDEVAQTKESHHLYPVLYYFRFPQPYYSAGFVGRLLLDALTLLETSTDDRLAHLRRSAAVDGLWRAVILFLSTLEDAFLPRSAAEARPSSARAQQAWRDEYGRSLEALRRAGVPVRARPDEGAQAYVSLRQAWEPLVARLEQARAGATAGGAPSARARTRDALANRLAHGRA